jgi:hypothetical protein
MDYLNALPVEIWLEILTDAASFINVPPDPHSHLSLLRDTHYPYDQAKQMQPRRLNLILVCKLFHRLAEPLLYTEIVLSEKNQFAKFQSIATTKTFYDQPCVNLTRSLFVYWEASLVFNDPQQKFGASYPQFPHNIFPNLISFVGYAVRARICSNWGARINEHPPPLTHTTFNPIGNGGRGRASYAVPALFRLSTMSLGFNIKYKPIENGPHSPLNALRSLSLRQREFLHSDVLQLELPSLRSLYLELIEDEDAILITHDFIKKHGKNLVELELSIDARSNLAPLLPRGLFEMCTALKTLSFTAQLFGPIMSTQEENIIHYHDLSNLIIIVDPVKDRSRVEAHSSWLSYDRFPNLSLITFMLDNCDDVVTSNLFRTSALTLFPRINLAFEK